MRSIFFERDPSSRIPSCQLTLNRRFVFIHAPLAVTADFVRITAHAVTDDSRAAAFAVVTNSCRAATAMSVTANNTLGAAQSVAINQTLAAAYPVVGAPGCPITARNQYRAALLEQDKSFISETVHAPPNWPTKPVYEPPEVVVQLVPV